MPVYATIVVALLLAAFIAYALLRRSAIDARFGCRMMGERTGHIEMRDDDRVARFSYELRDDPPACAVFFFDSEWMLPARALLSAADRSRALIRLRGWGAARGFVVVSG